jgi:polyisoprenyl-phosphate glycosyltransferase
MNQESARQKITAVIACYRDALAVPFMYQRLTTVFAKIGVDYEIIFVNDGSPDNADEVLAELATRDRNVVVVRHSRNFGSQNAFTSGMRISTGDAVVLLDGDLQDPPELIESFYQRWREGFDVVYGIRVKRVATRFLQVAYKVFYRIFRATSYVPMPLDAGDFSLLDRRVVNALNQLKENNRFLRGLRAWVGFKQTGVPYVRPERMFGVTTNSVFRNLGWARKALFSFSYAPIDVMTGLAIAIVILSVFLAALQIVMRFVKPELVPTGFTTLIVLILFMGGIQLLCFSVIGAYLMHIYDEVKRRPPYIVDYILNDPSQQKKAQGSDGR